MKILQFGRSMIEMLGVLAIIGVLSIGGLLGYRRAVNNHQANQILDDANRLAFVILESNQAFQTDDFMEEELIDSVPYTGTYNLDAFMAAGGQFGIVVTKVPKGVCEALLPKVAVEYKVRVMPGSEEKYLVPQMSNVGTIYDSFHKDICNDTNDIVLYFGDTSAQCNKPDEGETYTKCLSNAECCGGYFCVFENPSGAYDREKGDGLCIKLSDFSDVETATMSDGHTWTRSTAPMTWWSAQNWCAALGLQPVSRADIGCRNINNNTCDSSALTAMSNTWNYSLWHWLETTPSGTSYGVITGWKEISTRYKNIVLYYSGIALCH